jgi:tetratricopeptide (TPR) repeat protein
VASRLKLCRDWHRALEGGMRAVLDLDPFAAPPGAIAANVRAQTLSGSALEGLILEGRDASGLMLIVDYAESRQDDVVWLADRMVQRAKTIAKPARLVLLSRGSGVWWKELVLKTQSLQYLCGIGGDAYDEIEIPEAITVQDRRSLFDASVKAFLPYRSALAPNSGALGAPSDDLVRTLQTEEDYDRPLAVHIAALLHVAGVDAAQGRPGMASLLDKILGLEYEHWNKALNFDVRSNLPTAVKNGVAQVTLVGHVDNVQAAEELIGNDPLYRNVKDIDVPRVVSALVQIFPGADEGLGGLEPDLIGEHHVLKVITDALVDACLDWAGANREQRQHILTVLNRATRAEHGVQTSRAEAQLDQLVRTRAAALGGDLIKVALETPGRLLDLCPALELQLESLEEPALAAIDDALPLRSLTLMELSLRVAERRTDLARKMDAATNAAAADAPLDLRVKFLHRLATRVGTLGVRLSNLGRREQALAAAQEAVDITRRLAQMRPDAFLRDLAGSLNNLGAMLANLGRREQALAATQEAVDIRRRLAQTRPDAFLATSLNNLGLMLSNLGRREQALAATQEAV